MSRSLDYDSVSVNAVVVLLLRYSTHQAEQREAIVRGNSICT